MRQSKWNIDEVLLAVNTYLEIKDTRKITPDNPKVIELSKTLRSLPIHKNKNETFRNVAGVHMILLNIASLDVNSRYHLQNSSNLQKIIYSYFINKINKLRNIVIAIKACLPLPFEYYNSMVINPNTFIAGNILFLYHLYLENITKISKTIREDYKNRKKSKCICCGTDLRNCFGGLGYTLLELHYSEEVINYFNGMTVLPGKFVPLCPNCHRLAHTDPDLFKLSNLQKAVREESTKHV